MHSHTVRRICFDQTPEKLPTLDLLDTAVAAGSFKILAATVTAAGLVPHLKGAGPFTVFAPTDEAFAKLPAILTYQVVAGKVRAAEVMTMDGKSAAAANGATLAINTKDSIYLNGASKVVAADIDCTNGVIHAIDTVLMPSA